MDKCSRCNEPIHVLAKTRKLLSPNGNEIVIQDVPYEGCECDGGRINVRTAAMIELYAGQTNQDKEVSFTEIEDLFYEIPFMDLIDPNREISRC